MRVAEGQVTIPIEFRDALGLFPEALSSLSAAGVNW